MFKLIISDNTEIPVSNGSTLFDIMVEPVQYSSMWNHLTERNLKHVRLVSGNGDLLDQKENLVVDSEHSFHEKESVKCHFYLREKTEVELLREQVAALTAELGIHDGAIVDMGDAISSLAEEGGNI